jgi:hypothetical protein
MASYQNFKKPEEEIVDFTKNGGGMAKSFKEMEIDWRKYLSMWRSKPDLFLDFIQDPESKFNLFFYQRIMLRVIFRYRQVFFTFTRGSSKSFVQILGLMLKCIMYPRIKLTITAPTKAQASQISQQNIESIWEFFPILKNEVKIIKFEKDYTRLVFHNGASLDCIQNTESSRGMRRHGLSVEEIIAERFNEENFNTVLLPIMANNRISANGKEDPNELHKPQVFVTTAGTRQSFAFQKLKEVLEGMAEGKSAFVLGSGYFLPTMHKLLSIDYINDLKESPSFNVMSFEREMGSVWTGTSDNSLVKLEDFNDSRVIANPEDKAVDKKSRYILAYDVARAEGNSNANSALVVIKIKDRGNGTYSKHVVNVYSMEGTIFKEQARFLKKKCNDFNAEMLIIDGNGLGIGLVDVLVTEHDENPPYEVVNDDRYNKYKTDQSIPMIYMIKSQSKDDNASDIHNLFMNWVANKQVKFIVSETNARTQYKKKNGEELASILAPHIMTDLLQEEVMNLEYVNSGGKTKVRRISKSIQKDKFSALEYGLWYIHGLEKKNRARLSEKAFDPNAMFLARKPKLKF